MLQESQKTKCEFRMDPVPFASNGSSAMDFEGFWAWLAVPKQGLSATLFWPQRATLRDALPARCEIGSESERRQNEK